jgi:hypothetical protein
VRRSVPKTKIVAAFGRRGRDAAAAAGTQDATLEFAAETAHDQEPKGRRRPPVAAILLSILVVALVSAGAYWKDRWLPAAAASEGSLRIESDPIGAEVRLDGSVRGTTPLSLSVPAGTYMLSLRSGINAKELPVTVSNSAVTVHHIAFPVAPPARGVETGHLSVATDPPGSSVVVDGVDRGIAPLTVFNLPVGQHRVAVRTRGTAFTRTVQIEAGTTASVFIGGVQTAAPGSIAIASPIPMQVYEDRRLIGTSEMDRIMLAPGEHVLELVAESVSYRATREVRITAGQTTALSVDLPRAPLSINAVPWAEVFIDGIRLGETPLGNLPQTLGPHELVFRHPQLGERRVNTVVTLKETNRVSVDMRQR